MNSFKTEQEKFWAGEFGDEYISRNKDAWLLASNTALFSTILRHTRNVHSVIEFGANIGMNIHALKSLLPHVKFSAIEINAKAVEQLSQIKDLTVYHQSIFDFSSNEKNDFVFSKGVLIHLEPTMLPQVYKTMYENSNRYICMIEYYNPTPMEIPYREHSDKMYKRDFAGELMETYPDLQLVDYGFVYRRDPVFMQGDTTWFLMEKKGFHA
ncbi:MAG: pseudaminic acid biosynthesis-associated methylase [Sulfurospirillaceae bacterium]|nr:pseudaminic acid biosynthesis-associated methylase [Sulfurospirillaceae bacterium]